MMIFTRALGVSVLAFSVASAAEAQVPVDPSGHWEGSVLAPELPLDFSIDLVRTKSGETTGTINIPREGIEGLPLSLSLDGSVITFATRADQPLTGVLSSDGQAISGEYQVEGFVLPFKLTRKGDARVPPPLVSAPIDKALEGTWNGTLGTGGAPLRVVLTMLNQPDGSAAGTMVVVDQGGLRVPVAIRQDTTNVTIDIKSGRRQLRRRIERRWHRTGGHVSAGCGHLTADLPPGRGRPVANLEEAARRMQDFA